MRSRAAFRLTLGLSVVLGLAILILVNYVGSRRYTRFDWTKSRLYSLSDKTLNVLKGLKEKVTVTVFMVEGKSPLFTETQELLRRYQAASPLVSVEILDPTRNLARAEALAQELGGIRGASVVFSSGSKKKHVTETQLAEYDYGRASFGEPPQIKTFRGEQEFTSAILTVTQAKTPKILFTMGHGERPSDGSERNPDGVALWAEALKAENATVETWQGMGAAGVPDGTDCVVIAGPEAAFPEPEVELIRKYLAGGGRLFVLLDPNLGPGNRMMDTGLAGLLAEYGAKVDDSVVIDPDMAYPGMGADVFLTGPAQYRDHAVTRPLVEKKMSLIFQLGRSIRLEEKLPEGVTGTVLIESSANGWGETDLKNLATKVEKDDADVKGPVAVGAALERTAKGADGKETKARLVLLGDSDFASNRLLRNSANLFLATAAVNWLLEREALVSIPPRPMDLVDVALSRSDMGQITFLALIVMPLAAIALGVAVWVRRRR